MVQLLEPERRLLQVHVEKAKYLNRTPLCVPGRDALLEEGSGSFPSGAWKTSEEYKSAALRAMLDEVNRACIELQLPEHLPITASNLTEARIETPFFAQTLGRLATIATDKYVYGTDAGRLNYINRNSRAWDDWPQYLYQLKTAYAQPKGHISAGAAHQLATQWLAAASADVAGLERDCRVLVEPWELGTQFVPFYRLRWLVRDGREGTEAAYVELLEPERRLVKLWVEMEKYNKRQPIIVPEPAKPSGNKPRSPP
jgi:hypothetical protein